MTFIKRTFIWMLAFCLLLCAGCADAPAPTPEQPVNSKAPSRRSSAEPTPDPATLPRSDYYTLNLALDTLPLCWNPHMWESDSDALIRSATVSPLVDVSFETGSDGVQHAAWLYELADSVEDVTADFPDSEKWGVSPEETGRVWRIRLKENACWNDEGHTPITADSYVYSMRALLDPQMQNYRSSTFRSGRAAILGAENYYHAGSDGWQENDTGLGAVYPYSEWRFAEDGTCTAADGTALYFSLKQPLSYWLEGHSFADYVQAGFVPEALYQELLALADEEGYVPVTAESADLLFSFTGSEDWGFENRDQLASYTAFRKAWPAVDWESVGFLKEDDFTLLYICAESTSEFDLLYALTTPFLVYEPLYEAGKFTYEGRLFTDYGSSAETSMSCGPYALTSVEGTLFTLERNENWFGYQDSRHSGQFQTDRILLRIQNREKAAERFAAGEVDLLPNVTNGALMQEDGFVYHFFLVTDSEMLTRLQETAGGLSNKTCLANAAFRRGFSLALDRAAFAAADNCCQPALGLIGSTSYDSVSRLSRYRSTEAAMRAICNAYGADISASGSVSAAYSSLSGRNLSLSRHLFTLAYEQMVADGSWQDGMTISLNCAVCETELTDALRRQNAIVQQNLNEAIQGTGFEGKLTITFCPLENRYDAVSAGEIEMGFGAWGAAAFDPYSLLRCFCDPTYASIHEYQGFKPDSRLMTVLIDGELETRTFTEWCRMIQNDGKYADDPDFRRMLLARLEEALLMEYRSIPVCEYGSMAVTSAKLIPGACDYDILYGFGGLRSLRYAYDDAQWAAICNNG